MPGMTILQPVVVLAIWTMIMWFWLYATRLPALAATGIKPDAIATDKDMSLDAILPPQVQWKAHNYNHLHEAPTVFYAIALTLALLHQGDGINTQIAWAYVALRIAHSLVQATINKIPARFALFALSSLALMALVLHAALAVF